jgi:hypothetical protein
MVFLLKKRLNNAMEIQQAVGIMHKRDLAIQFLHIL